MVANGVSPSTPLALKVTTIVYNPPFQKFLDPPLESEYQKKSFSYCTA